MLAQLSIAMHSFAPAAPAMQQAMATRSMSVQMQSKEELAAALNPAIGYFDPLGLGTADFWTQGNECATRPLWHRARLTRTLAPPLAAARSDTANAPLRADTPPRPARCATALLLALRRQRPIAPSRPRRCSARRATYGLLREAEIKHGRVASTRRPSH